LQLNHKAQAGLTKLSAQERERERIQAQTHNGVTLLEIKRYSGEESLKREEAYIILYLCLVLFLRKEYIVV
jgi:hypothetical protein